MRTIYIDYNKRGIYDISFGRGENASSERRIEILKEAIRILDGTHKGKWKGRAHARQIEDK